MRTIDADKLLECYEGLDKYHVPVSVVKANIEDMPTVDAEPVVRCKDCKHWFVDCFQKMDEGNWWCADGERKDGADNDYNEMG